QTYRGQFLALKELCSSEITESCSARDIEADVIIFYDVHSCHHIQIDGIASHPSLKYEYFNDPHQTLTEGIYRTGMYALKLNAQKRTQRALDRGVNFIICPFTEPYYEYIAPHLQNFADEMFIWFPTSPDVNLFSDRKRPLTEREPKILGNGAIKETSKKKGYTTRAWAHEQSYICHIPHFLYDKNTPCGQQYPKMLAWYAAAIALTDDHIVPKYLEIPLAGCICFASDHQDYRNMGFIDGVNCYFVDKSNLKEKALYFLNHIEEHQIMADAGRKLVEDNWTADHFARFIYNHAEKNCNTPA
ncbi:MAG: glycosyltransferase, partial [Planctomycetota bacterium]